MGGCIDGGRRRCRHRGRDRYRRHSRLRRLAEHLGHGRHLGLGRAGKGRQARQKGGDLPIHRRGRLIARARQHGGKRPVERGEHRRIELLAHQDRQRHDLSRLEGRGGDVLRHDLADRKLGLRHPESACECIHHALVGVGKEAIKDLFDVGGRATLAGQHARGCDPLPLRLAKVLDRCGEELPRLAGAQGSATCSGSRPLALSLSIG